MDELTVSLIVVTWRRPDFVRKCLASIDCLDALPQQVIVVDASEDHDTERVVAEFRWATHHRFPGGAGHMTTARNEGLRMASGEIVAFLDDDTEVRSSWLAALRAAYQDSTVEAVAGRTCNGQPGEEREGMDEIGRLLPDGRLTGNFAADPGRVVDIDHGIGANMSFRRSTLARLGRFRDDFPGTALREDADIFLRITMFGGRAVFVPDAVVDHRGAPHVRGERFDRRYQFWGIHNHALLLSRNFGFFSSIYWRWQARVLADAATRRVSAARWVHGVAVAVLGLGGGLVTAIRKTPVASRMTKMGRRSERVV